MLFRVADGMLGLAGSQAFVVGRAGDPVNLRGSYQTKAQRAKYAKDQHVSSAVWAVGSGHPAAAPVFGRFVVLAATRTRAKYIAF